MGNLGSTKTPLESYFPDIFQCILAHRAVLTQVQYFAFPFVEFYEDVEVSIKITEVKINNIYCLYLAH